MAFCNFFESLSVHLIYGVHALSYSKVLYIFANLQSFSIWTRKVKNVYAHSVHDMRSCMTLANSFIKSWTGVSYAGARETIEHWVCPHYIHPVFWSIVGFWLNKEQNIGRLRRTWFNFWLENDMLQSSTKAMVKELIYEAKYQSSARPGRS